jgi:CheY-like chemotaxis protein
MNEPLETILLLDINMALMNGWEVLEALEAYEEVIKDCFTIYMFSSSISIHDKTLSYQHRLVADCIEKPFTKQKLENIVCKGVVWC